MVAEMTQPNSGEGSTQPERSLNRQIILEEDEYTAALSHIIARDFFPSLVHLDATNGYLDAVRSRDPNLIAASVRRLEEVSSTPLPGPSRRGGSRRLVSQTPGRTPYASSPSDTPYVHNADEEEDEPTAKRPRYDTTLSLDEFQARYTSEDNSSFTQILDEENKNRRERYGWAWDAQARVEAQRGRMLEARERSMIEPPDGSIPGVREKFRIEAPKPAGLITGPENNSQVERRDEEKAVVKASSVEEATEAVMAPRKDNRTAGVDGWNFKTRNSFMFPPDADISPYHPPAKLAIDTDKKGESKIVSHGNTRLKEQEHASGSSGLSEPPSPTRSRINAAITGTPYRPNSPTLNDIHSLVPTLPNPTPEQLGPEAMKHLMTWGTLNATPRVLSRSENEELNMTFKIRETSSREALSRKLATSASKNLRAKAEMFGLRTPGISRGSGQVKGDMGPPTRTPRRAEAAGSLTPAAKRLLERSTHGVGGAKRTEGGDLSRVRWTPTPGSRMAG